MLWFFLNLQYLCKYSPIQSKHMQYLSYNLLNDICYFLNWQRQQRFPLNGSVLVLAGVVNFLKIMTGSNKQKKRSKLMHVVSKQQFSSPTFFLVIQISLQFETTKGSLVIQYHDKDCFQNLYNKYPSIFFHSSPSIYLSSKHTPDKYQGLMGTIVVLRQYITLNFWFQGSKAFMPCFSQKI